MDNQYNQPGGGYPPQTPPQPMGGVPQQPGVSQLPLGYQQAYTSQQPYQPQTGYNGQIDYSAQQPYGAPQQGGMPLGYGMPQEQNPQQGYGAPQQGGMPLGYGAPQQNPYTAPYQVPYGEPGYEHKFDPNQPVMGEQPPAGFPPQQMKPVKHRFQLRAWHVVLVLVVLAALGVYLFMSFKPEAASYGYISIGNLSATHGGEALIVRNESPYDAEGMTSILYDAEEGSTVYRGDYICKVYSSSYSTREMKTLQEYREQIRDYQQNLIETENTQDAQMERVNSKVQTLVREVRDLISGARGSLANQEELLEQAVEDRQKYLEQKYASDQRFSRLLDDERSQTQRIDSWTKQYTATTEGMISFYSDGYEYGLTGENYTTFDPAAVRRMINGEKPEKTTAQKGKTTIYRMVKDGEWYVLFLSNDTDWNPVKGQLYSLQLERFEDTSVAAEVVSFTRSGGELLVRLKVTGSVEPVLYMRSCEAVLGENMTTLMADERAIYVQDDMTGVVVMNGENQSFIPVNVILYHGGNVYFQTIQQNMLQENMTVRLF